MAKRYPWLGIAFLLGTLLSGPVWAGSPCLPEATEVLAYRLEGGVGGTGQSMDPGGIGGTGHEPEGGIGGTGLGGVGGTGIFGTVTAFGSICVNGLRIHYDDEVPVWLDGSPASTPDLALGQVVWIEAEVGADRLEAESIRIFSALVGTVEDHDEAEARLRVGDVWIAVSAESPLVDSATGSPLTLAQLRGRWVRVSGLPDEDGRLLASRVETRPDGTPAAGLPKLVDLMARRPLRALSLEGYVSAGSARERLRIQGVELQVDPGVRLERNTRVWTTSRIEADRPPRVERLAIRPERQVRPETPTRPEPPTTRAVDPAPDSRPPERPHRSVVRPERIERPERPERPLRVPPVGKPIRPERPDRPERPKHRDVLPDLPLRHDARPVR